MSFGVMTPIALLNGCRRNALRTPSNNGAASKVEHRRTAHTQKRGHMSAEDRRRAPELMKKGLVGGISLQKVGGHRRVSLRSRGIARGTVLQRRRTRRIGARRGRHPAERPGKSGTRRNPGPGRTTLQRVGACGHNLLDRHDQRLEPTQRFQQTSGGRVGKVGRGTEMGGKPFDFPFTCRSPSVVEGCAVMQAQPLHRIPHDG